MPLPPLTHLQFSIIDALGPNEFSGADLRQIIAKEHGIAKSLAAFYTLMKRLEDSKFLQGRYELTEIEGYRAKERFYKTTGKGMRALRETMDWYANAGVAIGWSVV